MDLRPLEKTSMRVLIQLPTPSMEHVERVSLYDATIPSSQRVVRSSPTVRSAR